MFPLGAAFGLLVVQSGLDWWWALVLSVLVYAGSMEFLAVGLLVAVTPLPQLALTTFLVNFRHVFYALSFPLQRVRGRAGKAYSMYALTDEAYALTAARPGVPLSSARILWLQGFCQGYWVAGSVAGALLGSWLAMDLLGLAFTLTALFVVLAMDAVRVERDLPDPGARVHLRRAGAGRDSRADAHHRHGALRGDARRPVPAAENAEATADA